MIKTILFDIDWVIIKSAWTFSRYFEKKQLLKSWAMQEFFTWVFKKCSIWEEDLKIEIEKFFKKWNYNWTSEEILDLWFKLDWEIDYEVFDFIKSLKNKSFACYMATQQEKYRAEYLFEDLWLKKLFEDKKYISSEIKILKPTKQFFEYILKDLELEAKKIIFIDDEESKLTFARDIWINAILYKNLDGLKKDLKKYIDYE